MKIPKEYRVTDQKTSIPKAGVQDFETNQH